MSNNFFRKFKMKLTTINPHSLLNYNNNYKNKIIIKKNYYNDCYLQTII